MNGYKLSKAYWEFAFNNPDLCKPSHAALFMYIIEVANLKEWVDKFPLPTDHTMGVIGIKSYSIYKKVFDELVLFGMIKVVQSSKNQFTSNIIAFEDFYKATSKAHDKATVTQLSKQVQSKHQSNYQSKYSIIKLTNSKTIETVKLINSLTNNLSSATAEVERLNQILKQQSEEINSLKTQLEEEKKKVARKKKEETTPHWKSVVGEWHRFYGQIFREAVPSFEGEPATNLKGIMIKLKKRFEEDPETKGQEWTSGIAVNHLHQLLYNASRDKWLRSHFLLKNIHSNFDSIVDGQAITNTPAAGINASFKEQLAADLYNASRAGGSADQ